MFEADFEWEWIAVHQVAFDKLKQAMINTSHLSAVDPRQRYLLYTDASKDCVGATLAQRCAQVKYKGHLRPIAFMSRKMQSAKTRYPIREQEFLPIVLALKQGFPLLRGPQQVHVDTYHESLRHLKTCPPPLTPRQARWSQFLAEYNLTLWYVPGLENPAADACYRLTSQQLMDIENATRTRAFVVPLVENHGSPEGELVNEFLHVLEDSFSHDEVWSQPLTTCTCHSEADAPLGRILMLTSTPNQPSNSTPNQPSSRRNWSHCRWTRGHPQIHTSPQHTSTTLAMRYQTCQPTPMTFPR